jgi:endoglucanase
VVNQVRGTGSYPQWRGCNLVGGGAQGSWEKWTGANVATRDPGEGPQTPKDYTFPTAADVDYLISKGMNVFRLLFNHEAIQPEAFADIPYNGDLPNPARYRTYYSTFKALVDYITITKGKTCLIDIYNAEGKFPEGWVAYYLRQFSMTPTSSQEDGGVLADLWGKLATIFINNPLVWFGIHNEPTTSAAQWYPVA